MQQASWYLEKLKNPAQPLMRWLVRQMAARKGLRGILNRYYGSLGDDGKSRFRNRYAEIFRSRGLLSGTGVALAPGDWGVSFAGRQIRMPLRTDWAWLDWDAAISAVGHDVEITQTYAAMIQSNQRPAIFLDVGANYGMHSLLFLSAGIPVIAFEPNPTCFTHFQVMCELNGLRAEKWEQVAIGSKPGQIELVYPEKGSWFGSVSPDRVPWVKDATDLINRLVPLKTLDEYLADIPAHNVMMAIDVEGFEPEVILGASQLLASRKPKIVFESLDPKSRGEMFRLFAERGYGIHSLPWAPSRPSRALGAAEFDASTGINFIAIADPSV
jgi:FkbM family methyltransferase